jgi:arylsulfatase A
MHWETAAAQFILWGLAIAWCPTLGAAERPPNVIFILADDLGYRELGCFGQQKIKTPCIDSLARDGLRLTQHYAGSPVCAPSRCVLLTGKHPGNAFVRDNRSTPPEGQWPIPDHAVTLLELFQQRGYATGVFGKWGLGGPESTGEPLRQGVDRFAGYLCQSHAHSYYPDYLWQDRQRMPLANNPPVPGHAGLAPGADPRDPTSYEPFQGTDYAPDRIHEQALDFLRQHRDQPFFLYYPSTLPHVALHVPQESLEPYLQLGWKDPPFTRATGGYTPHFTPRAAYAGMISHLDAQVGSLLAMLEELGLRDNTIVVFSSDNGTTHLREEVDYEFFDSVGELRGLKGSLYEGGIRVPTIACWPGNIPAGEESAFVSGFEDWLPTLLELTGNQSVLPEKIDGVSIAPTLLGQEQPPRSYLYREFPGYGGQQMIRVGDWKAVRQGMNQGSIEIELYDLGADVGESRNLAHEHPQEAAELSRRMAEVRTPSDDFPLIPFDRPVQR